MVKHAYPNTSKKCIPGIICVENMTLFMLVVIGIVVAYLYWQVAKIQKPSKEIIVVQSPSTPSSIEQPRIDDAYNPPLKTLDIRGPPVTSVVPINIRTNGGNTAYQQLGILTKSGRNGEPMILPLMGRSLLNGRDKWQYYTLSNSPGAGINTRLPLSVNGKSCTGEYGCDSISNGDTVYVEGYNDTFRATIYENSGLNYLPY